MCRHHRHGRAWRRLSREEWVARLEEYQRDLEEEIADVADMLRRLKEETPPAPAAI